MNNFNHSNDKLEAPHCDFSNNSNQLDYEVHSLKYLMHCLKSSYEGFYRAHSYSASDIEAHLRAQGECQKKAYIQCFGEALLSLSALFEEMKICCDSKLEGK